MALYNHLYARKNNGKWILRIEDTDAVCFPRHIILRLTLRLPKQRRGMFLELLMG